MIRKEKFGLRSLCLGVVLTMVMSGSVVSPPAFADQDEYSLDAAIALVREKSGGKVLRADTKQSGERRVHEIRILTDDGHVRTYVVDAQTGRVK